MGVNTGIDSSVVESLDFYPQNKMENRANIEEMETHSAEVLKSSETIPLLYGLHVWNYSQLSIYREKESEVVKDRERDSVKLLARCSALIIWSSRPC